MEGDRQVHDVGEVGLPHELVAEEQLPDRRGIGLSSAAENLVPEAAAGVDPPLVETVRDPRLCSGGTDLRELLLDGFRDEVTESARNDAELDAPPNDRHVLLEPKHYFVNVGSSNAV